MCSRNANQSVGDAERGEEGEEVEEELGTDGEKRQGGLEEGEGDNGGDDAEVGAVASVIKTKEGAVGRVDKLLF